MSEALIQNRQQIEEREAQLLIATGTMGVGKTHQTKILIDLYRKYLPNRRVLIFDPNNEDFWKDIPSLAFDITEIMKAKQLDKKSFGNTITNSHRNIMNFKGARRILPFDKYGEPMSIEQMKATMLAIMKVYKGGLVLLDDINKYISNFEATDVKGMFKAIRHSSQDVIIHMQSIDPLRKIHYEACSTLRYHRDTIGIDILRPKLGERYDLFKIAHACQEQLLEIDQRAFIYIYPQAKQIGLPLAPEKAKQVFDYACRNYVIENDKLIRPKAKQIAFANNRRKPSMEDEKQAMAMYVAENQRMLRV